LSPLGISNQALTLDSTQLAHPERDGAERVSATHKNCGPAVARKLERRQEPPAHRLPRRAAPGGLDTHHSGPGLSIGSNLDFYRLDFYRLLLQ
jgi:hypothetical protein